MLLSTVRIDTNVLNLFPQEGQAIRAFQTYLQAFGRLDRVYVVVEAPDGGSVQDFDADIDKYVETLRSLPEVHAVDDGRVRDDRDWRYLLDRQLLLLDPATLDRALARFRPPGLDAALADARVRLTVPSASVRALVQQDPLGLLAEMQEKLGASPLAAALRTGGDGYLSADGRARLLLIEPSQPPFDSAFARAFNVRLEEARAVLPQELSVQDAGGYRIAAESERIIKSESLLNGTGALAGILLLMAVAFRSLRAIVPILLPIIVASIATVALYSVVSPLSVAAAGSAAILFGIGVDHTLLLYVRTIEHRAAGGTAATLPSALATTAGGIAIAVTTTAATFFGLLVVDLPALRDLGRVGGIGILMCGVLGVLLLPALLPRITPSRPLQTAWLARFVRRHRALILIAAVLATIGAAAAASRLRMTPAVDALAPPSDGADLERRIAERFDLPRDALFAVGEGEQLEPLLDAHARLARSAGQGAAIDVIGPAHLLPPADVQAAAAARIAAAGLRPDEVVRDLTAAAARAGFRPEAFAPFVERLPVLLDASQRFTLDGYERAGLGDLLAPFVTSADGRYVTVSYVYPQRQDDPTAAVAVTEAGLTLTGIGVVNDELESRFGAEFLKGGAVGLTAVLILVVVGFGSIKAGLWALVPVALGLFWTAGILGAAGVALDLFSVFGVLMCVGIGVDYGVHLWHRRRQHGADGLSVALTRTAPAILLSGATSMIGFGSLIASSYPPLRGLGLVTAVSIGACLVAALVVVPALQISGDQAADSADAPADRAR